MHVAFAFWQRDLHMPAREGERRRSVAFHKHAVPVVTEEERQRKIGIFALMGKFFDDGALGCLAHAVYAVETLAHAIGNRGIAVIREHAAAILDCLAQIFDLCVVLIV